MTGVYRGSGSILGRRLALRGGVCALLLAVGAAAGMPSIAAAQYVPNVMLLQSATLLPVQTDAPRAMSNTALCMAPFDLPANPPVLDGVRANRPMCVAVASIGEPVLYDEPRINATDAPVAADAAPPAVPDKPIAAPSDSKDAPAGYAMMQSPPSAPPTAPSTGGVVTTIVESQQEPQRVRLVKDKSLTLSFSKSVARASIASPEIADVLVLSPTQIVVTGKSFGSTQLVIHTADEEQKVFDLFVEIDLPLLRELIRSISPTANVQVRSLLNTVVLTGAVPDAMTAERIAELAELLNPGRVRNQLMVAGQQQVLIRCTVAEVNRSAMRELNMNWFFGGATWSREFFFANNLDNISPTQVQSSGLPNLLLGQQTYTLLPNVNNVASTNITLGFPRAEIQAFVQALRENGLVRVLAEPNLIAISGQKATFLAGGEVPIPIAQDQNTISIEFKRFGVQLEFTPYTVGGQMIRLTVAPEFSEIDPANSIVLAGFTIPGFSTRRAETTVEVGNGQTFALAGLLNETVRATARKIPGIGDVPVLGTLFSSMQYQRNETELVILVTPELVSPLDPQQVGAVPGQLIREPTDAEFFLGQQLEGRPLPPPEVGEVPRNTRPINVYPGGSEWTSTAVTMALRGPCGMSFDEEEER